MTVQSHGRYNVFTRTHQLLFYERRFPREYLQIVFPKTLPNHSIQPFSPLRSQFKKIEKLNFFINTVNAASQHLKRKAMTKYPNQFNSEEDWLTVVDPFYIANDENDSTPCSSLVHCFMAKPSDLHDPIQPTNL